MGAPPPTCLVVEDTELDRRSMERVLSRQPNPPCVVFASSLAQARAIVAEVSVSLIFLDNSLPDGNGADFLADLADRSPFKGVPVVIVSDWPSPFMFAKAKAGNVLEIWSKSEFTVDRVREVLERGQRHA